MLFANTGDGYQLRDVEYRTDGLWVRTNNAGWVNVGASVNFAHYSRTTSTSGILYLRQAAGSVTTADTTTPTFAYGTIPGIILDATITAANMETFYLVPFGASWAIVRIAS